MLLICVKLFQQRGDIYKVRSFYADVWDGSIFASAPQLARGYADCAGRFCDTLIGL